MHAEEQYESTRHFNAEQTRAISLRDSTEILLPLPSSSDARIFIIASDVKQTFPPFTETLYRHHKE